VLFRSSSLIRELTKGAGSASKNTVNGPSLARHLKLALAASVIAAAAFAQSPSDPPASSVVSTGTDAVKPAAVKPAPVKANDSVAKDSDAIAVDPASLLPDLPPVPRANATLIGGTIGRLDRVRDQLTVNVFGGGRATILFDPRTKVYRGSKEVTTADLRQGERVYLDTILDGSTVFARAIRLSGSKAVGESQGVVLKYRQDHGELMLRDGISPQPVRIRTNRATTFLQNNHAVNASTLQAGSLISVTFSSEGSGRDLAKEISILALPGSRFTFSGQVLHIDLRSGLLVLNSATDHKTYEIYLDPSRPPDDNLHTGSNVTVVANFENSRYVARELAINPAPR
jgi:hypothetical protein